MRNYEETLNQLKKDFKEELSSNVVLVVASCDSAYKGYELNKIKKIKVSFNDFCVVCNDVWLDSDDNTGLTTIADMVAEYIKGKKELPTCYSDVYDYSCFGDDEEGEDDDE